MIKLITALLALFLLTGCSGVDISHYRDNEPRLDLFSYFSGQTKGWGIVQDRGGTLTRQFVVTIDGEINASGQLVLTEDFIWNDGEKTRRIWTIQKTAPDAYSGSAADVEGEARGVVSGNALNWNYNLLVEIDGSQWSITFDDWMFLQPDGVLLNRATMTKFGFHVGEVIIAFKKPSDTTET